MSKTKRYQPGVSGNPVKKEIQELPAATWKDWVGAARLRTLPLAVAPVVAGAGASVLVTTRAEFHWVIALCCLAVAVFLQIGVNYANDYSDGIRGTDDFRVGPARLTGGRRANPKSVLFAALASFGVAAVAGLAITIRTQHWWLIAVGVVCIVAAWFYTGGKRPYGYAGLGELFVFIFFGLVATIGTTWVMSNEVPQESVLSAVALGLLACAVLLANNLRDIEPDREAGKHTLSTRIGAVGTKVLYTLFVLAPIGIAVWIALFYPIAWLALLALLSGLPAILIVWTFQKPRELIVALSLTSLTALIVAGALFWAFWGA